MNEKERSQLYVYIYSDFDDDFIFAESKYTLEDLHILQQENEKLQQENQQLKIDNVKLIYQNLKLLVLLKLKNKTFDIQECKNKELKEVIEKAINDINLLIELIILQPTKNDNWILNRLNGLKVILEDKEVK